MAVNFKALTIASSAVDGLAIMLTLFRLLFRLRIRRFWWEDAWAGVVCICGFTLVVVKIIWNKNVNNETTRVTGWVATYLFTATIWAVRMSLLCSIIRVTLPLTTFRKVANAIAAFLCLCWAALTALKVWWCTDHVTQDLLLFRHGHRPLCYLPKAIVCFQFTTDCVSDTALVMLSLKLLWRVKLPRRQRRMILSLFSSTAIMSMFSIFHAICQLDVDGGMQYVAFEIELASALIVCNLLVLVTYMYRVILRSPDGSLPSESESSSEDDDFTTPLSATHGSSQSLTTIEVGHAEPAYDTTNGAWTSVSPSSHVTIR